MSERASRVRISPLPNMQWIFYGIIIFVSYAIGRISHILGGHLKTPHHWIYGVVILIVGIIFHHKTWGIYPILFGMGFIISDFNDMINLRFYGADNVKVKKFWGID